MCAHNAYLFQAYIPLYQTKGQRNYWPCLSIPGRQDRTPPFNSIYAYRGLQKWQPGTNTCGWYGHFTQSSSTCVADCFGAGGGRSSEYCSALRNRSSSGNSGWNSWSMVLPSNQLNTWINYSLLHVVDVVIIQYVSQIHSMRFTSFLVFMLHSQFLFVCGH